MPPTTTSRASTASMGSPTKSKWKASNPARGPRRWFTPRRGPKAAAGDLRLRLRRGAKRLPASRNMDSSPDHARKRASARLTPIRRAARLESGPPAIRGLAIEEFSLTYDGFDPRSEGLREVLTSTGNGRFCARGTAEWQDADGVH